MAKRDTCGLLIHQIHNVLEKNGNNQLREKGLTFSQMNVLVNLLDAPGGKLSFKDLERRLALAQSTTVGLIARLEQKGLVVVLEDREDRRMKSVEITPQGERCCSDARAEMDRTERQLLSPLSEGERESLCALLERVNASLQKDPA